MARFDVYRLKERAGLVLDVQADHLSDLGSRVVVPLRPAKDIKKPIKKLNPIFAIEGQRLIMMTQQMAAILSASLGKPIGSLAQHDLEIRDAVDFLFIGF